LLRPWLQFCSRWDRHVLYFLPVLPIRWMMPEREL
jgi:hypothetical protein